MTKPNVQFEKPVIQRSYITITDAVTKARRCVTIYGVTPDQVIEKLQPDNPETKKRTVRQERTTPVTSSTGP